MKNNAIPYLLRRLNTHFKQSHKVASNFDMCDAIIKISSFEMTVTN